MRQVCGVRFRFFDIFKELEKMNWDILVTGIFALLGVLLGSGLTLVVEKMRQNHQNTLNQALSLKKEGEKVERLANIFIQESSLFQNEALSLKIVKDKAKSKGIIFSQEVEGKSIKSLRGHQEKYNQAHNKLSLMAVLESKEGKELLNKMLVLSAKFVWDNPPGNKEFSKLIDEIKNSARKIIAYLQDF